MTDDTTKNGDGEAELWSAIDTHIGGDVYRAAAFFNRVIERVVAPYHQSLHWGDRLLTLDKSAGFQEQPAFARALAEIAGQHPYDQYMGPGSIGWRLHVLAWAVQATRTVPGDLVECGTFKGDMAFLITQVCDLAAAGKTLHLFDSFDGYSPTLSSPDDFPGNPGFFDFANTFYREEGIYEAVCKRFADNRHVRITKGFLPESLDGHAPDRVSFLHVDLNSPKAEIACLDVLFERISPGGIVLFDDYGWKLFRKQKDAEDAFMTARGHPILELPTGQGLVFKQADL